MLPLFDELGHELVWLSVPFTTLIGWVFIMMELVGDYSENPFEGLPNDIPMMSLCRTIEIDLRAMLDETDLPPRIEAVDGVLM
ncbi:MAG: putative membrane protein [Bacteroidia bacterium]|jgi:putative membrane protein